MLFRRRETPAAEYPTRASVFIRLPKGDGTTEEFEYTGRVVREVNGWLVLADVTLVAGGRLKENLHIDGEQWLRRETIVHLQGLTR
ncbi:MAG: hypothetical protein H7123_05615 [Thermoleophilia bacterium]|nr:hypothetical protein [Thermoleophilia bacterium]